MARLPSCVMPVVAGSLLMRREAALFTRRARNSAQRCRDWCTSLDCARRLLSGRARGSCGSTRRSVTSKVTWLSWNAIRSSRGIH